MVLSSRPPWHEHRLEPVNRPGNLGLLNGSGRIHILGADHRALTYKGTLPDPLMPGDHPFPLGLALITGVEIVPLRQGNGGRTDEGGFQAINWASSVAEHTVDTHAELLIAGQLSRALQILTLGDRFLLLPDDPRLDFPELLHEVVDVDDQVTLDRKIRQGFHADR